MKRRQRGISIIEIVVSMIIIMVAMAALAFVYPQGRRVTESSDKRTKATEIAKTILEEVQILKLEPGALTAHNSIQNLSIVGPAAAFTLNTITADDMRALQWPYHHYSAGDANSWTNNCPFFVTSQTGNNLITEFKNHRVANPPKHFALCTASWNFTDPLTRQVTNIPRCISSSPQVDFTSAGVKSAVSTHGYVATVSVSVLWLETRGRHDIVEFVTLTSAIASNRYAGGINR